MHVLMAYFFFILYLGLGVLRIDIFVFCFILLYCIPVSQANTCIVVHESILLKFNNIGFTTLFYFTSYFIVVPRTRTVKSVYEFQFFTFFLKMYCLKQDSHEY